MFLPGNHDCYPRLREYPLEDWRGGKVRRIRSSVLMLERGYIFDICGYTCFCMGGASSHDKACRTEGKSWWPEELPSKEEYELAAAELEKHNDTVDYIFTHCGPKSIIDILYHNIQPEYDDLTTFFENYVNRFVAFKAWFMGHYHVDRSINNKYHVLYDDIIELLPNNEMRLAI